MTNPLDVGCSCGMSVAHFHIGRGKVCFDFSQSRVYLEGQGELKTFEFVLKDFVGRRLDLVVLEDGGDEVLEWLKTIPTVKK